MNARAYVLTHRHTHTHRCTLHTLIPFRIHTFNATSVGFSLCSSSFREALFSLVAFLVFFDLGGVKTGATGISGTTGPGGSIVSSDGAWLDETVLRLGQLGGPGDGLL